jgi:hypothetical protein
VPPATRARSGAVAKWCTWRLTPGAWRLAGGRATHANFRYAPTEKQRRWGCHIFQIFRRPPLPRLRRDGDARRATAALRRRRRAAGAAE